jgi:drug/metabolite transporter (DMT)-like permease
MEVAIALGLAILFGAIGDILLSKGMRANDEIDIRRLSDLPKHIRVVFRRPLIMAGLVLMAFFFFSYIAALAYTDVSVANPLTALSYVLVTFYATLAMREHVSWKRWVGVSLVTLGAIFVGLSS